MMILLYLIDILLKILTLLGAGTVKKWAIWQEIVLMNKDYHHVNFVDLNMVMMINEQLLNVSNVINQAIKSLNVKKGIS